MPFEKSEIELYSDYVRNLADKKSNEIYRNSGALHASVVFSNMFRTSEKQIRIFSRSLGHKVTSNEEYLQELKNYLERGGILSVMLEECVDESSDGIRSLFKLFREQVKIKTGVGKKFAYKQEDGDMISIHFATADSRIYRVEFDTNGHKARGSFNQKEDTEKLEAIFDQAFAEA